MNMGIALAIILATQIAAAAAGRAQHTHQHSPDPTTAQSQGAHQSQSQSQPGVMIHTMHERCRAGEPGQNHCGMMMHGPERMAAASPGEETMATKAYLAAMAEMHTPMMAGAHDRDADAAFVKSMIPHHRGAIDMAKIVLQHGRDEATKKWAADIIRSQEREIAEMRQWLERAR